jgi:acetoin utilization deacetylase AcuC-like enzyme
MIFYSDLFSITLPPHHTFPIAIYRLLSERVRASALASPDDIVVPHAATDEEILRVHTPDYLRRLERGELTEKEIRRIGLPWSPELVLRARHSAGATIEACRAALSEGVAVNLGGGTHHAYPDYGQGYCILNDAAIAARAMQAERRVQRILIVDCDVHQGNGTAAIFRDDPWVFTFSIHGENNFPLKKEASDLDIALEDGTSDQAYLAALREGLEQAFRRAKAELAIYLAGADAYKGDRFGRLKLSKAGLQERDQMVFSRCLDANLPIAVTMAGGYAPNIDDIVDIHLQTVKAAGLHAEAYKSRIGAQPTSCGAQDESEALLPPDR